MRVLVVGSGGREHALVWGLSRSPEVDEVVAAPGNPGIGELAALAPVRANDPADVARLADELDADLVVVGPEEPLVNGAADAVRARGRAAFGPGSAGAMLEGSKDWMKSLLAAARVPTAAYASFDSSEEPAALAYLERMPGFYVVKTDGLAAGKGVLVTESIEEARDAVRSNLSGAAFGGAGRRVVIEEGLTGPELSLLVLCDGKVVMPLPPAQDFKRVGDGDEGPNTGGMGAYSPVPLVGQGVVDEVMATAVEPTLEELQARGIDYRGVLYAGIMLTPTGPKVLEYNVRFGDPECQALVPRLASDLAVHCREAAEGALRTEVAWRPDACVTVVLASEGYPAAPRVGDPIEGLAAASMIDGVVVFHAGTRREGDAVVTSGGRVLAVTGVGGSLTDARRKAYEAADQISWRGMIRREDIAAHASSSERAGAGTRP